MFDDTTAMCFAACAELLVAAVVLLGVVLPAEGYGVPVLLSCRLLVT